MAPPTDDEDTGPLPAVFTENALVTIVYHDKYHDEQQHVTGRVTDIDGAFVTVKDQDDPSRRVQVDTATGLVTSIRGASEQEIATDVDEVRFNAPPDLSNDQAKDVVIAANKQDAWQYDGPFRWYDIDAIDW